MQLHLLGEQSGERVVSLGQGPNELRLSAFNGVGEIEVDQSKQPVVTLTYEREAPASTGPVAGGDTTPPTTGGSLGGGLSGGPTGGPPPRSSTPPGCGRAGSPPPPSPRAGRRP